MIEAMGLEKSFGPIRAVDGVSFTVEKGDVLGFMGPNGAGKSTTMKMLSCFFPPDSGTARIEGYDIVEDPVPARFHLGYLSENAPAYDEMTVSAFLRFICDARGIKGQDRYNAIAKVSDACKLGDVMHQPVETLSKGYRRRVGLAQTLVHDPPVLLLDEPTDGLDPNQKHDVRQLIEKLAPTKSILVSTHILEEVDAICNRIIVIDKGKILVDTTPDDLREKEGGDLQSVFRRLTKGADSGTREGGAA